MPSYENQGARTSGVFAGAGTSIASRKIYGESAELFATWIAHNVPRHAGPYVLADVGSFKGELMGEILCRLPDHRFETVAVDINPAALAENTADRKIVADLSELLLDDKTVDITICRYVLQWNPPDKQRRILRELERITKRALILQHFGCDDAEPEHRARIDAVLSGRDAPKLLRRDFYLASASEIESWLGQQAVPFVRQTQVRVDDLSDSFIDRYELNASEAAAIKSTLGAYDYIVLTTWILAFAPNGATRACERS